MRDERNDQGDERELALTALERFRAGERVVGEDVACLLSGVRRIEEGGGQERRREALVERAAETGGLSRDFAELIFATAQEEGVEPAFAFELVLCGVGVLLLDERVYDAKPGDRAADDGMTMAAPPEEMLEPVRADDDVAERERRLRLSFRRLRHHIEASRTPEDALVAFAAEPDIGRCRY